MIPDLSREAIRRLVLARPIPDRLIETLSVAPLLKPHQIDLWVRCGGRISYRESRRNGRNPGKEPGANLTLPPTKLTKRELEVITLFANGLRHKEVCLRMEISAGSLDWYLRQTRFRLGADNNEQAVLIAASKGLIELPESRDTIMADLNTGESQVLAMFWEGASLEEIGEAMEIPLNTVKMRLRAARRKMNQTTTSDAAKVAFGSRRR